MDSEKLFTVERIKSGWLLTEHPPLGRSGTGTRHFDSWKSLCDAARKIAFPYPNENDPRGGPF